MPQISWTSPICKVVPDLQMKNHYSVWELWIVCWVFWTFSELLVKCVALCTAMANICPSSHAFGVHLKNLNHAGNINLLTTVHNRFDHKDDYDLRLAKSTNPHKVLLYAIDLKSLQKSNIIFYIFDTFRKLLESLDSTINSSISFHSIHDIKMKQFQICQLQIIVWKDNNRIVR